jgi:hypothetical protein
MMIDSFCQDNHKLSHQKTNIKLPSIIFLDPSLSQFSCLLPSFQNCSPNEKEKMGEVFLWLTQSFVGT